MAAVAPPPPRATPELPEANDRCFMGVPQGARQQPACETPMWRSYYDESVHACVAFYGCMPEMNAEAENDFESLQLCRISCVNVKPRERDDDRLTIPLFETVVPRPEDAGQKPQMAIQQRQIPRFPPIQQRPGQQQEQQPTNRFQPGFPQNRNQQTPWAGFNRNPIQLGQSGNFLPNILRGQQPFGGGQQPFGGGQQPFGGQGPFGGQQPFGGGQMPFGGQGPFGGQQPFGGGQMPFGGQGPFGGQQQMMPFAGGPQQQGPFGGRGMPFSGFGGFPQQQQRGGFF